MLALIAAAVLPALVQITATPDTVAPPLGSVQAQDGDFPNFPGPSSAVAPGAGPSPLAAPPSPIPGQPRPELWRGAKVGMSVDQVRALNPEARQAASQLVTRPPVANAVVGASAVLAVDEQVFGYPAVATYYFGPTGLLEVVVNVGSLRLHHTLDNVTVARSIRDGLFQYYGRPKVCLDTDKRGLARLDCRWTARSVQVGLSYVDYGGLSPNLDVAVRAMPIKVHETGAVFARHGVSY
jgi:hypothetical protein